jgi:hypothetical protein
MQGRSGLVMEFKYRYYQSESIDGELISLNQLKQNLVLKYYLGAGKSIVISEL